MRARKMAVLQSMLKAPDVNGDSRGELLVVGWGSTSGAITSAVNAARQEGLPVSSIHLRWLNPLPADLGDVLGRFRRVLVPELNMGQLAMIVRARYLIDAVSLSKVQGRPFTRNEILDRCRALVGGGK
jgi:2-oxoglutarate ferredoxin oxidoreductase subunit alpha